MEEAQKTTDQLVEPQTINKVKIYLMSILLKSLEMTFFKKVSYLIDVNPEINRILMMKLRRIDHLLLEMKRSQKHQTMMEMKSSSLIRARLRILKQWFSQTS